MSNPLTFFDFCSGIGSAHLAFKNLGLECIGYSEIDKKSEKTYNLFFGNHLKNFGDLMQINPNNLNNFDILVAGFPCQSFSIIGNRKGFEDERGQIIYGISKIIKEKQPKAFLLENVKGLVNLNKGKAIKDIISLLNKCNYQISYSVLESTDYGIPQARERVYIVGIRNDIYSKEFKFPKKLSTKNNLENFLISNDKSLILEGKNYETFLRYLNNKYNYGKYNLQSLLTNNYLVLDSRQSDLRIYKNKIPTLRTGRQGILYIKDNKIRKLSGLEALLLQGFDLEKAELAQRTISQTSILSQAGNSMTVNVMQEIGKNILEYIS
jgi:DNA (cytosine-5)-methyltransferase 1